MTAPSGKTNSSDAAMRYDMLREQRLADAAGADHRQEALTGGTQPLNQRVMLSGASDQGGGRRGRQQSRLPGIAVWARQRHQQVDGVASGGSSEVYKTTLLLRRERKVLRQARGQVPRRRSGALLDFLERVSGAADARRQLVLGQVQRFATEFKPLAER